VGAPSRGGRVPGRVERAGAEIWGVRGDVRSSARVRERNAAGNLGFQKGGDRRLAELYEESDQGVPEKVSAAACATDIVIIVRRVLEEGSFGRCDGSRTGRDGRQEPVDDFRQSVLFLIRIYQQFVSQWLVLPVGTSPLLQDTRRRPSRNRADERMVLATGACFGVILSAAAV
jgi:hypothetical protein